MRVAILKQGPLLIASLSADLTDEEMVMLRDDLAEHVGRTRARAVVIDISLLDVVDSFATRTLRGIAHATRLRGAETVIVGIQPDVAFSMVQLGLTLEGVETTHDLEDAIALLDERLHGAQA